MESNRTQKKLGPEIARLRTMRGWSRTKLLHRCFEEIENASDLDADDFGIRGEAWLARLERDEVVKISREELTILCRALACTEQERLRIFILADRNIFADEPNALTDEMQLLSQVMAMIYHSSEAREMIMSLLGQREVEKLSTSELLEIIKATINVMIEGSFSRRWQSKSNFPSAKRV